MNSEVEVASSGCPSELEQIGLEIEAPTASERSLPSSSVEDVDALGDSSHKDAEGIKYQQSERRIEPTVLFDVCFFISAVDVDLGDEKLPAYDSLDPSNQELPAIKRQKANTFIGK